MSQIKVETIRKLREETGAPIMRVKKVLEQEKGDENKALEILKKEGFEKASTRLDRATGQGKVFSYIHHSGKIGTMVEIMCETDFVARNELFEKLGKDIAMQIASLNPRNLEDLKSQEFIKDPSKKISDLVKEVIAKTGENVQIGRFERFELGK